MQKIFVLEREKTKQTDMVRCSASLGAQTMNIQNILENIPHYQKREFKIFDAETNSYLSLQQICPSSYMIPIRYLILQFIIIRYSEAKQKSQQHQSNDLNSTQEKKKDRSKQRTIREVLELVCKWRKLQGCQNQGKKVTLLDAAREVGVSKKSLDDYYFQLRIGEKNNFDFLAHMNEKIGVLRNFIKETEPEKQKKDKNEKHPKKLRIIDEFEKKFRQFQNQQRKETLKSQNSQKPAVHQVSYNSESGQLFWAIPDTTKKGVLQGIQEYEKNYFKDFEVNNDNMDPIFAFSEKNSSDDYGLGHFML